MKLIKLFLVLTQLIVLTISCRTTNMQIEQGAAAPSTLSGDSSTPVEESNETQCNKFGGEFISNSCVCSDGSTKKQIGAVAKTCNQWVKKTYPKCYANGGTAKKSDQGSFCVCPQGEVVDAASPQTCFQKYTARDRTCSSKGAIVLADDRVCRCLDGTLASTLGQSTCEQNFRAKNRRCYDKRGTTFKGSSVCKCRDGSTVDNSDNQKCERAWFFYASQSVIPQTSTAENPQPQTQPNPEETKPEVNPNPSAEESTQPETTKPEGEVKPANPVPESTATCRCRYYKNNCLIYRPGATKALEAFKVDKAFKCTEASCYDKFQKSIFGAVEEDNNKGGCGGSWNYESVIPEEQKATESTKPEVAENPANFCVCKSYTGVFRFTENYRCGWRGRRICTRYVNRNSTGCGLFKNAQSSKAMSWAGGACTEARCVSMFGNSYSLRTHCKGANGKFNWRYE